MKRNMLWSAVVLALGAVVASGRTMAAQGGGGGGMPAVESSNNLSYPAVLTGAGPVLPSLPGQWSLNGVFPTSMSFGCATPELIGTAEYPNTPCVTSTGAPLSYDDCRTICGAVPVERAMPAAGVESKVAEFGVIAAILGFALILILYRRGYNSPRRRSI